LFGLNVEDINKVIRAGFSGESAGQVFEGERRFDLVVRLDSKDRKSIEDVKKLFVLTPSGVPVTVEQVADVTLEAGPNQIQRDDAKRRVIVGFNVRGRDVQSVVEEIDRKISAEVRFAPGYFLQYSGSFKNLEEARQRLAIAVPVALLLIFLLLFFAFNSLRHGLLIYTAIPLSAIGGILALWLRGMPFSISAGVGFIALFGVAVLNGIVLIAEFNHIRDTEPGLDLFKVVIKGTHIRLRPVIMTALVASLGFLPMALSGSAGSEVQRPLATVVIGGLVSATFLTLVVLPVLYTYFEKRAFDETHA
jgi:cobalt-zinc-cadmium resistance protein CzcA